MSLSFVETEHCNADYITVYDGATKNAQSSKKICAKDNHITLNESQGNISSPGYPFGKLDNELYTWTIQGKTDSYIVLDISDLEEDCQYDYLRIYDGSTPFGNFCSSTPPGLKASTGNSMFVVLKTNRSNTYKGFYGNYEIRGSCQYDYITVYDGAAENDRSFRKVCDRGDSAVMVSTTNKLLVTFKTDGSDRYRGFYGEFYSQDTHIILNEPKGFISSPGYPIGCLGNMFYTWTIQGKADTYIVLNISDIGEDCQHDYLRIYDGPTTFSPLFGNFCSSVPPGLMVSTGNSMFIALKQHGPNTYKGFVGNYEIR
ncbi:deleted in malignant brain tumors 1 protein-like, partial [Physella acuta]|uniref:deleted in malignant brain tumors 1 protein-like n=1 Tax=Physella acuta TaxID=109671 RepID=UPI0027DB24E3